MQDLETVMHKHSIQLHTLKIAKLLTRDTNIQNTTELKIPHWKLTQINLMQKQHQMHRPCTWMCVWKKPTHYLSLWRHYMKRSTSSAQQVQVLIWSETTSSRLGKDRRSQKDFQLISKTLAVRWPVQCTQQKSTCNDFLKTAAHMHGKHHRCIVQRWRRAEASTPIVVTRVIGVRSVWV